MERKRRVKVDVNICIQRDWGRNERCWHVVSMSDWPGNESCSGSGVKTDRAKRDRESRLQVGNTRF